MQSPYTEVQHPNFPLEEVTSRGLWLPERNAPITFFGCGAYMVRSPNVHLHRPPTGPLFQMTLPHIH
jgi:hypothetical protein